MTVLSDFALARYNTDGSLDTTFGTDGKVTTDFGSRGTGRSRPTPSPLTATGRSSWRGQHSWTADFALARYNTDGSLDTTFGTNGKVMTDFGGVWTGEYANALAIDSSGKIVAAGSYAGDSDSTSPWHATWRERPILRRAR